MACRGPFLLVLLVGLAPSAFAQSPQPIPRSNDAQFESSKGARIVLEMRWLALTDNFSERLGPGLDDFPVLGSCAIRDKQQIDSLLAGAIGDKRSNAGPVQRVALLSGQKRELSPPAAIQGGDAIVATASDDRKTIEIALTWPKRADGTETLPVTTAMVPVGSYLLIHTEDRLSAPEAVTAPRRQQSPVVPTFLRKNVGIGREKHQVFLLISSRIAVPGQKQRQPAAK